jgi:hypothetical protein
MRGGVRRCPVFQHLLILARRVHRNVCDPVADIPIRHEGPAAVEMGEVVFPIDKNRIRLGAESIVGAHDRGGRRPDAWLHPGRVHVRASGLGYLHQAIVGDAHEIARRELPRQIVVAIFVVLKVEKGNIGDRPRRVVRLEW